MLVDDNHYLAKAEVCSLHLCVANGWCGKSVDLGYGPPIVPRTPHPPPSAGKGRGEEVPELKIGRNLNSDWQEDFGKMNEDVVEADEGLEDWR